MAKLTDYTNPISGSKGNLFDAKGLWSNILGVAVFIGIFYAGEKLVSVFSTKSGVKVQPVAPFAPQAQPTQSQGVQVI